jgi:hypothetical protein
MAMKATKPNPPPVALLAIEADELHQPEIDAFIERNREVLNESLERSYEEIARGEYATRTIEQIIKEGTERFRSRRQS